MGKHSFHIFCFTFGCTDQWLLHPGKRDSEENTLSFLCWIPCWTASIPVMKNCPTHWMTLSKQLCFTASVFSSAKYHWYEVFHVPHRNAFIKHFGKYDAFFKSKQMLLLLDSLKEAFLWWRETLAYRLCNSIIENLRQNIYDTIIPSKPF